jgi:hypothetical protein
MGIADDEKDFKASISDLVSSVVIPPLLLLLLPTPYL